VDRLFFLFQFQKQRRAGIPLPARFFAVVGARFIAPSCICRDMVRRVPPGPNWSAARQCALPLPVKRRRHSAHRPLFGFLRSGTQNNAIILVTARSSFPPISLVKWGEHKGGRAGVQNPKRRSLSPYLSFRTPRSGDPESLPTELHPFYAAAVRERPALFTYPQTKRRDPLAPATTADPARLNGPLIFCGCC
jgi:hypothetical protein